MSLKKKINGAIQFSKPVVYLWTLQERLNKTGCEIQKDVMGTKNF